MVKVQRLSRKGVGNKLLVSEVVNTGNSEDIVQSLWRHKAVTCLHCMVLKLQ